jgi:hypothetical protein
MLIHVHTEQLPNSGLDALFGTIPGAEPQLDLGPGDRVRSFDFAGVAECYVEGTIESITEPIEGCPRYKVRVEQRVFNGALLAKKPDYVFPPVNGTPTMTGKATNLVVRA